ncbi:hypothetical protein HY839_00935 [Candidatus Azambacteria bacterium]|nr:hypothetical protein [Candidatus Azambacteria bacterium]
MLTSKSLFHSNLAILFPEQGFAAPDNGAFAALCGGKGAEGARFFDDPFARTKMLTLPALGLKAVLEGRRLRVEDESASEPDKSRLTVEASRIAHALFPNTALEGFGLNIDATCRFNNVIRIQNMFEHFFGAEPLGRADLRDFGFQFTIDRGAGNTDIYFIKITAPLEIALHVNRHFAERTLPAPDRLQQLFEDCYNEIDTIIAHLKA